MNCPHGYYGPGCPLCAIMANLNVETVQAAIEAAPGCDTVCLVHAVGFKEAEGCPACGPFG